MQSSIGIYPQDLTSAEGQSLVASMPISAQSHPMVRSFRKSLLDIPDAFPPHVNESLNFQDAYVSCWIWLRSFCTLLCRKEESSIQQGLRGAWCGDDALPGDGCYTPYVSIGPFLFSHTKTLELGISTSVSASIHLIYDPLRTPNLNRHSCTVYDGEADHDRDADHFLGTGKSQRS